eukprot:4418718-Amphidinium_carterae.1
MISHAKRNGTGNEVTLTSGTCLEHKLSRQIGQQLNLHKATQQTRPGTQKDTLENESYLQCCEICVECSSYVMVCIVPSVCCKFTVGAGLFTEGHDDDNDTSVAVFQWQSSTELCHRPYQTQ